MRLPFECTLILLGALAQVQGLRFHAEGRRRTVATAGDNGLDRRANLVGLKNTGDINYMANITVGDKEFECLIDTGSSDLWVAGTPNNAKDTGKKGEISYAIGAVSGPIKTTEVKFAGYTISKQAYLEVTPDTSNKEGSGLIGLGPNSGSTIWAKLKPDTAGVTLLDNIFAQNKSTPNYMTFTLGRNEDPTNPWPGDFTIGEVMENFTDVSNQPKLSVTDVPVREEGDQHFQILMDKDGLLGPDSQSIKIKTRVDETSDDYQPTAIVDTGFSLSQVPKTVADALYSRFDGAEFVNVTGIGATWIVPCEMEVNITFTFGGKQYPIHPLDATLNPELIGTKGVVNSKNQDCCIGTFQPITFNKDTFDVILGMSFLRNVYALIDYGDFATNNNSNKGDPYIQFLSTTDKSEAHQEFVNVRLDGVDTTGQITLSPFTQSDDSAESSKSSSNKPSWFWYIIIGGAIAGGLFLILLAYLLFRKKKGTRGRGTYAKLDDPHYGGQGGGRYSQNMDMHALPNMSYNGNGDRPYDPQGQGQAASYYGRQSGNHDNAPPYDPHSYNNPWDHRH